MIYIDGSYGEGGGQVLRTSLTLATLTGTPLRLDRIRAKRKKPGLAAQHLTCVRAAAALCNAECKGDALGEIALDFIPQTPPQPGEYLFDVTTAGAVSLIVQTVLMPLALTPGESLIALRGGTYVPFSPPVPYLQQVFLPLLERMGVSATVELVKWGWYPHGGGEIQLRVTGGGAPRGLQLRDRGELTQVRGLAVVTELPSHIPQRMANRAENVLRDAGLYAKVEPRREKGIAPGAALFLTAEYERSFAGCGALGRKGLPSDRVADMACEALLQFHHSDAAIDRFLADQLLLPAALASEESHYRVADVTLHLTTNAWAIEQFGLAKIHCNETEKIISVYPTG